MIRPHDPSPPEKEKFKTIETYSDMPDDYQKLHRMSYEAAVRMIKGSRIRETENFADTMTYEEGMARAVEYGAFLSVQIHSLQQEIKRIYAAMEHLALSVDQNESDLGHLED